MAGDQKCGGSVCAQRRMASAPATCEKCSECRRYTHSLKGTARGSARYRASAAAAPGAAAGAGRGRRPARHAPRPRAAAARGTGSAGKIPRAGAARPRQNHPRPPLTWCRSARKPRSMAGVHLREIYISIAPAQGLGCGSACSSRSRVCRIFVLSSGCGSGRCFPPCVVLFRHKKRRRRWTHSQLRMALSPSQTKVRLRKCSHMRCGVRSGLRNSTLICPTRREPDVLKSYDSLMTR